MLLGVYTGARCHLSTDIGIDNLTAADGGTAVGRASTLLVGQWGVCSPASIP